MSDKSFVDQVEGAIRSFESSLQSIEGYRKYAPQVWNTVLQRAKWHLKLPTITQEASHEG